MLLIAELRSPIFTFATVSSTPPAPNDTPRRYCISAMVISLISNDLSSALNPSMTGSEICSCTIGLLASPVVVSIPVFFRTSPSVKQLSTTFKLSSLKTSATFNAPSVSRLLSSTVISSEFSRILMMSMPKIRFASDTVVSLMLPPFTIS